MARKYAVRGPAIFRPGKPGLRRGIIVGTSAGCDDLRLNNMMGYRGYISCVVRSLALPGWYLTARHSHSRRYDCGGGLVGLYHFLQPSSQAMKRNTHIYFLGYGLFITAWWGWITGSGMLGVVIGSRLFGADYWEWIIGNGVIRGGALGVKYWEWILGDEVLCLSVPEVFLGVSFPFRLFFASSIQCIL